MESSFTQRIDAILPQTQCTRCGFAGCLPYARAIACGDSDIDRCPPGGDAVVAALAALTGRPSKRVDPSCGVPGPLLVATIDESACIGCTLCIAACPVDAIIGAQKRMHAILPSLCSGCELCVAPCPVDCIDMIPSGREWTASDARDARLRHRARNDRVARGERIASRKPLAPAMPAAPEPSGDVDRRREAVAAALARARARRASSNA